MYPADTGGSKTARRLRRRYGRKRRRGRYMPKTPKLPKSAITPKFFDPDLSQWWSWFQANQLRSQGPPAWKRNLPQIPLGKVGKLSDALFPYTVSQSDYSFLDAAEHARRQQEEEEAGNEGFWGNALNTTLDILSRPYHASAEAAADFGEEAADVVNDIGWNTNTLRDIGDMFRAGGAGAWQGLSGQQDTSFAELLRGDRGAAGLYTKPAQSIFEQRTGQTWVPNVGDPKWWREHNKTTATVGFTGDVLLDPTTYIGLGLVGKLGTGARRFKDAAGISRAVKSTEQAVKDLVKAGKYTPNQADKIIRQLTAQKFRQGFQKQAGAKAAEGGALKLLQNVALDKSLTTANKVYDDTLENLGKLGPVGLRDRKGKFMSPATIATEAATKAGDEVGELTTKQLLDNYRTIVNADYKKTLGIGTRNYRLPVLPSATAEGLAKIAQLKPLRITGEKIQQALRNSYKVIEDVYRVKVEGMHLGRSSTFIIGRYIDDTFKQIDRESRRAAWVMGLRRQTTNGEMPVRAPGAAQDEDAAVLFSRHVASMDERMRGDLGELPFGPEELNRNLPPGLPPIFGKKSQKEIAKENGLWNEQTNKLMKGKKDELRELWTNQEWVRSSLLDAATNTKIKGLKDGGHALWLATAAIEHAVARRKMLETLAESFGFSSRFAKADDVSAALINDLKKRGWRAPKGKGVKELKDTLFNPQVAEGIERMLKTMEDQREWNGFLKFFNRITNPWKFLVTMPIPGYHIRNMMGDAFINWIDGAINPADYRAAARMLGINFSGLKKFEHVTATESPLLRVPGDPMQNALRVSNKPLFKNSARLEDAEGQVKDYVLDSELYAGINKHGIRQNYASSEFGELESEINTFGTKASELRRKVEQPFRSFSEQREDFMRLAHFVHLVRRNPSKAKTLDEAMEFAGDRVRMTHFDYMDFTKFEQQVMSNVIPFYKWTRKSLPLMARFMFEHPGKVIIPDKITANLAGAFGYWPGQDDPLPGLENSFVPDWLIQGGYQPGYDTPGTGNPMFMRMPSPFSDALAFQANPATESPQAFFDNLIAQSNPLIRIPYETLNDKQTMFAGEDVPIDNKSEYALNQLPIPGLRPYLAAKGTFHEGESQYGPLASMLTGFYSRELTPAQQRGEIWRRLFEEDLTPEENARLREILRTQYGVDI